MIGGLNTSVKRLPNYIKRQSSAQDLESVIQNSSYVSATYGYGPVDIKTAYNLSSTTLTGSGQTIALVEFDGYKSSDITYYVKAFSSYFGSSYTPLVTFESVNGYDGTPTAHGGAAEVILDIEMALNLAPAATIEVFCDNQYTDNNFDLDMMEALYDNVTSGVISTSWGNTEVDAGDTSTDHAYYELFAAEGVSFFAASGDYGCYDAYADGGAYKKTLEVDYPASDPNVTGVGGTTLYTSAYTAKTNNGPTTGADGSYKSETTWNDTSYYPYTVASGAGGGGVSTLYTIPWYQSLSGIITSASLGSTTYRNVPDVSLNADQYSGYAVYMAASANESTGAWDEYGGTSAAAPLWAAFTALVNQKRVANGLSNIGFMNTVLYNLALTSSYSTDFHDIADSSTNGYYPAVAGYDLATGLGSFNGVNLLNALATENQVPTPTFSPAAGTYSSTQSVTISDSLSGATIFYTTDGTTPSTSSSVYSLALSVSSSKTIKAIAVASGYTDSAEESAAYTISSESQVPTPTFSPAAGTYTSAQSVTISDSLSGVTIYYTTNGSTPTTSSSVYSSAITVSATETINAIAVKSGYTNSSDASATYTITSEAQVPTPTFSPVAGTYTSAQSVTISDSLSGVTIYYTTNGSTPTTSSSVYSSAITVSATETINAIAVKSGYTDSSEASATYTIIPIIHGFGSGWQMISSPVDSSGESLSTIFSTAPTKAYWWIPSSSSYSSISDGFTPGKGYWINDSSTSNLYGIGTTVSASQSVNISLQTGWNLIGNPRTSSVSLSALNVVIGSLTYSLSTATNVGYIYPTLYTYQSGDTAYETTSVSSGSLQPYYGYWIYSFSPVTLTFPAE
jgi:hypothetical protein